MSLIYEPSGKAREYSPLALNVYSGGCDHFCSYCYCKDISKNWINKATPRDLSGLKKEALRANRQITLSFMGDPYCQAEIEHRNTRTALLVLKETRCSVAILTKGGTRCLDDIEIFKGWPGDRLKVGATLTFESTTLSKQYEPGAALPEDRLEALKYLKSQGIKTWASIEPVIYPEESISIIKKSLDYVDAYKVGKLNHIKNKTDWEKFAVSAVTIIREAGKSLYVKEDLRLFAPFSFLLPEEGNPEKLFLPDRPPDLVQTILM